MSFLLNTSRVKYECSCGNWLPLDSLYFCRSCVKPKCQRCVTDQVDTTFCPTCLENVPPGDAKNRRHLCQTCYTCPLCDSHLVTNMENDLYYLRCGTCRWTTRDAGLQDQDQAKSAEWPQHNHPYEEVLGAALDQLKLHSAREKQEKDKLKYPRRRSNLGVLNVDRYNLLGAYHARRRAMLEPLPPLVRSLEPTTDVPELDGSVFTEPFCDVKAVDKTMKQLFAMDKPLYPNRTRLVAKRVVRCSDCERPLYKPEYSPASIKSKIQMLAVEFIPDVRIWRPDFGQYYRSMVHFTVTNVSISAVQIRITPINSEEDTALVQCDEPTIEFTLNARVDAAVELEEADGCFLFKSGHRIGIRFRVTVNDDTEPKILGLQLQYKNNSIATDPENQDEWISTNVKLMLESI